MTVSSDRAKVRRERVQALAREDILEAALRCFAQNGYAQTKISDIAAAAGYTAASLYTYFPGKREIFAAAAEHFITGVQDAFGPLPTAPHEDFTALAADVRERITRICDYGDRRSEVLAFFMRLRWSGDHPLAEGGKARPAELCVPGAPIDEAAREHGPFKLHSYFARAWAALGVDAFGIEAETFTGIVTGAIESFFVRRYIFGVGPTLGEQADAISDLLLFGLKGKR